MNAQRGISALTVLVVIAILAVAAAIAFPAWQQHQVRGRVDDALKTTDAAKLVVMEAATVHGGLAGIKTSELGYNPTTVTNPHVARIEIADGGRITLTTRDTGASPDPVLVLIPTEGTGKDSSATISWSCAVAAGESSEVPASCRGLPAAAPVAAPTKPATPASASSTHSSS